MNKQNIVEKYNISQPKFDEILDDLNISQDTILFSDDQVALFERIFHLARQQKKGYKKAISIVLNQSANSLEHSEPSSVLDPKLTDFFHQKSATFAEQMIDETPHLLNEQRAAARKIIVDSFWKRINEIGNSEEFKRKFDAVLYGDDIVNASVLPGESSALPESSSSDS
ncbi:MULTISPECIES: hypothetical protein [Cyanophyceae]|uniref:hypothetical protein n=1 Tax=Cyanophyceae TaxID=3028117 RepID=UPI00016DCCF2|nr:MULTISPECIES: hypothetical protein [Cyanophyceae]ACB01038.1 hypothetical protein SYNPCC7002_F0107 [Picosynechococcus sp. PCC 7002]SMH58665.1 hypothetical protein SAMN06272755_3240 [Picosynechococcus sp. OG1]SMQ86374.1 hypothetical protein SAMN06272774_3114 [Synechococcus sp. 7002]